MRKQFMIMVFCLLTFPACSPVSIVTPTVTPVSSAISVIASPTTPPTPTATILPTQTATPQPKPVLVPVKPNYSLVRETIVEANVKSIDDFHRHFDTRTFALTMTGVTSTQPVTLVLSAHLMIELGGSDSQPPSSERILEVLGEDWLTELSAQRLNPNRFLIIADKQLAYIGGEFELNPGTTFAFKVVTLQRVGVPQYYWGSATAAALNAVMWSDEAFELTGNGVVGVTTDAKWNAIFYFRRDKEWRPVLIPLYVNQERRALQRNLETWDKLTPEQRHATLFGDAGQASKGVLDYIEFVDFSDAQKAALFKSFELLTKIDGVPHLPETYDNGLKIDHPFTVTNMLTLLDYVGSLRMEPGLKAFWLNPSGKSGRTDTAYGVAYVIDRAIGLNPAINSDLQMLMVIKEAATNLAAMNFLKIDRISAQNPNAMGPTSMHGAFLDHYPAIFSWLVGKEIEMATGRVIAGDATLGQRGFFMDAAYFQGK